MKIATNLKQIGVFASLFLAVFILSCRDQVVGVEVICPEVLSTFPTNNATNVDRDAVITVTFDGKMAPSTIVRSSFSFVNEIPQKSAPADSNSTSQSTELTGVMTYNDASNTMSFRPDGPLQPSTKYTGTVKKMVTDPAGTAMLEDYVWSFTTEAAPAPRVNVTDPENNQTNVSLDKVISATFNEDMNASTINQNTFTLFDGATQITGAVTFSGRTATFDPNEDLNSETVYTVRISTGVRNIFNVALEDAVSWIFTTRVVVVVPPAPRVVSTDPENNQTNVSPDKTVTALFNEAMDASTLNENTFTLFNGTTQIPGVVSFNNRTASFNPNEDLDTETTYTATITTGAKGTTGVALAERVEWTFTTRDEVIVVPPAPRVVSTDPENNQTNVSPDKTVTALFNEAMDALTLNENTFTLFDGTTQIPGVVSFNNRTASFNPNEDLDTETTYTATITTGAKGTTGVALAERVEWEFTTEEEVNQGNPSQLGSAATYGLMATAAITSTGNSVINGDVSLEPGTSITGFPPAVINGTLNVNNTLSTKARADLLVAYNYYKTLPPGVTIAAGADLGALYPNGIAPGTYTSGSTMLVGTNLVLDAGGDANAIWVFQIGSSLTTGASVTLTGGANPNNVFWVPTEDATIGVGTTFHGTIISGRDVTAVTGARINGRILAGAITAGTIALDNNIVTVPGN